MPTISGIWKWNDNLNSALSGISAKTETTFVSNGITYYGMQIQPSGRNVKISYATAYDTAWTDVFNGSWTNNAYATVDFGNTAVEMEQNFYTSFTKAATQQSTPTTVKAVSSANLAEFKAKCDETYAGKDEIPSVPAIPTPTTSDNGKVLGVANGAYALQAASGGGGGNTGHTITIASNALVGVQNPSLKFEKYDGSVQEITSVSATTEVENVVKVWADIGSGGGGFGTSGGLNNLATINDLVNDRRISIYSVSSDGSIISLT